MKLMKGSDRMSQKITDEYGNTLGKVENTDKNKYVVKDNFGNKVVSAEKELFGENYTIRDENGENIGKTEKEFFGKGMLIKNRFGKTVGKIEPSDGIGNLSFFALAAVIIIGYLSITSVPEILGEADWAYGFRSDGSFYFNLYFFCITLPLIVMGLINIACLLLKKTLFQHAVSFLQNFLNEVFLGVGLYLGSFVIVMAVEIIGGSNIFETFFMVVIMAIYFMFAYLLLMIPLSLVFAIILKLQQKNK